jgi:molybdate transport system substrate-binding protein
VRRIAAPQTAFVAVAALLAGCGGSSGPPAGSGSPPASKAASVTGTINVFAAASLQEAFTKLGSQFETAHPGTKVVFNFGPSTGTMDQVVASGDAANPTNFVFNTMEIAVPPKNPAHIKKLADLAKKGVKVALCQADVPCGATALKVFDNAKIKVAPVTEEVDVKSTLSKVTLGEVDAGVVYVTDVRAAGASVKGIEIPANVNASTTYPIAPITASKNKTTAQAFVAYVLSPDGLAALTAAGFSKP